jgi:hypothetical protein
VAALPAVPETKAEQAAQAPMPTGILVGAGSLVRAAPVEPAVTLRRAPLAAGPPAGSGGGGIYGGGGGGGGIFDGCCGAGGGGG